MLNGATTRLRKIQASKARPASQRIVAPEEVLVGLSFEEAVLSGIGGLLSARRSKVKRNGIGLKRGWFLLIVGLRGRR